MNQTKIITRVLEQARSAVKHCYKDGKSLHVTIAMADCFVVCYGVNRQRVIKDVFSSGWQRYESHAEFQCLRRFNRKFSLKKLKDIDLYNVRFLRNGIISNSRPCHGCRDLLRRYTPRRIYYTNNSGEFEKYIT